MTKEYELILKAQQGDKLAMQDLILAHTSLLFTIAHTFHTKDVELDDLVQEGRMALVKAVRTYKFDSDANFKTYASRCIYNIMCDELKKNKNDVYADQLDETSGASDDDPEQIFIDHEEKRRLREVIYSAVNENERKVLKLYLNGMTYDEISETLGVSKKKVDNTLFNLRKKVKKILKEKI